jgi:hypothetical protein
MTGLSKLYPANGDCPGFGARLSGLLSATTQKVKDDLFTSTIPCHILCGRQGSRYLADHTEHEVFINTFEDHHPRRNSLRKMDSQSRPAMTHYERWRWTFSPFASSILASGKTNSDGICIHQSAPRGPHPRKVQEGLLM